MQAAAEVKLGSTLVGMLARLQEPISERLEGYWGRQNVVDTPRSPKQATLMTPGLVTQRQAPASSRPELCTPQVTAPAVVPLHGMVAHVPPNPLDTA